MSGRKKITEALFPYRKGTGNTPESTWDNKAAEMSGDYAHNGETWKYAKGVGHMKSDIAADEKTKDDKPVVDNVQKSDNANTKNISPKESPEMNEQELATAKEMAEGKREPTDHYREYPGGSVYRGFRTTGESNWGAGWDNYVKDGEKTKKGVKHTGKWRSLLDK